MKHFLLSLLLTLLIFFLFGCSTLVPIKETQLPSIATNEIEEQVTEEPSSLTTDMTTTQKPTTTEANPFEGFANSKELMENYHYSSFDLYFSPEEFIELYEIAEVFSAVPETAINEHMFIAYQDLSTYDCRNTRNILMTTEGEILKEYSIGGWGPTNYKVGDFVFISTYDINEESKDRTNDVYRSTGEYVGVFEDDHIYELFDLGYDYYIFSANDNGYTLYILDPFGSAVPLYLPRDLHPIYADIKEGERAMTVGQLSDGLFSIKYDLINDGACAFYYNETGSCIIDLSYVTTNFSVYELGDFVDGKAEIKFIGADKKNYIALIDKTGEFIGEPVLG